MKWRIYSLEILIELSNLISHINQKSEDSNQHTHTVVSSAPTTSEFAMEEYAVERGWPILMSEAWSTARSQVNVHGL